MTLSQATVFNEFLQVIPAEISDSLRPHITGGQAQLFRYSVATEKAMILLGAYNSGSDEAYDWPNQPAGSLVDQTYAALFLDDAMLNYLTILTGASPNVIPVSGYQNRIKLSSGSLGFAADGSYGRLASLFDRDAKVGDAVYLQATVMSVPYTLSTAIQGFVADLIAANIAAATADAGNNATQSASATVTLTAGTSNDITVAASAAGYDGREDGFINETYTIVCTQVSTGGDATTARLSVTSASGLDNVASVTPSAFASPTAIGANGATVTFSHTSANFVVGQTWTLHAHQAFTASTATSGGTYTGLEVGKSVTYKLLVTKGGPWSSSPVLTVSRSDGLDYGTTTITTVNTLFAVGALGVEVEFNDQGLVLGDAYYIVVTTQSNGAYKTIVLKDNMPAAMATASAVELQLYIQKNIEVDIDNIAAPPAVNWLTSASEITVKAGMVGFDPSLTNDGVPFSVPVTGGTLYAQYRAWLPTYINSVNFVEVNAADSSQTPMSVATAALGTVDPDNPLAYAVYRALQNSNGTAVYYTAVADPTNNTDWTNVLAILVGLTNIRVLVPLTRIPDVLSAWQVHVDTESADEVGGQWRIALFSLAAVDTKAIVSPATTTDGNIAQGTISANPAVVGTPFTLVNCPTNNAQFITNGVAVGDQFRFLYSVDDFGNETYETFLVASIVNQDSLILATGNNVAVSTAQRFEIWRNVPVAEIASDLATLITGYNDPRVAFVWPDTLTDDTGETVDGMYLAAAVAGYMGGIAPQQGLRNLAISGFTATPRSSMFFSNAQLNTLEAAGCITFATDAAGNVFARRALMSDTSEEMPTRNNDAIKYLIYGRISTYFGVGNVTNTLIQLVLTAVQSGLNFIQSNTLIDRTGPMIANASVPVVAPSVIEAGRLTISFTGDLPVPLDDASITLML